MKSSNTALLVLAHAGRVPRLAALAPPRRFAITKSPPRSTQLWIAAE
jgi:hypothetical protein